MANTRELRRRIKSIKNTSQITKAMQMVAATKMRKAQNQAINGRPYSENLDYSLLKLITNIQQDAHPFLTENAAKTIGVILLSTDKGLVGALNTNLLRQVVTFNTSGNATFFTIGKKGRSFLVKTGKNLEADFENQEIIIFKQAKQIAKLIISDFLAEKLREVYLVYPRFVSALKQEPTVVKLLPINLTLDVHTNKNQEFLFEPNADVLLDDLLVHVIETKIYQALLETKASEHSARMMAMQNATDNAKDLVSDLQLTYNQTRQDAITRELLEITSAGLALQ